MNFSGGWWLPDLDSGYKPNPEVPVQQFCPDRECACSAVTLDGVPCWQCGGETTKQRPAWWPFSGSGSSVIGGNVWTPGEEDETQESAA